MQAIIRWLGLAIALILAGCSSLSYQPLPTLNELHPQQGYRLQQAVRGDYRAHQDDTLMVLTFSGGGTRAAAFGYGVLNELQQEGLLAQVDLVYGVSGGAVLAAYFALHGEATIPGFERAFLSQDLQSILAQQIFSVANWPRLSVAEFGRGDLLEEELDRQLFHGATFADLTARRKGPFAVISASDMTQGNRLDFVQEYFDVLCVDLSALPIARAVAASSAVPVVFSPLTLNNHGGQCGYQLPNHLANVDSEAKDFRSLNKQAYIARINSYQDSQARPFIHLLDGGLTDNLGLRSLLDATEIYSNERLYDTLVQGQVRKVVVINVNAQTQMSQKIDASPAVPGLSAVLDAVINIPIDKYSQDTLHQFRQYVDLWNAEKDVQQPDFYFISINLLDLPDSALRERVAQIPTTFHLPRKDVENLAKAAQELLHSAAEYQRLLRDR